MHPNVKSAILELKFGKFILITDDHDRENEADLCCLAELVTTEHVNFMINHARGLMTVPLSFEKAKEIGLPLMVQENVNTLKTAFTLTIDAKEGITSGISSRDRAYTVKLLTAENISIKNFETPGHVFPLIAHPELLAKRQGHTEAAIEMAKLSNAKPVMVICETLNDSGEPLRGKELVDFANKHQIRVISIDEIQKSL